MLRFTTAGESHGPALLVILEGVPAGLSLSKKEIDHELHRRQLGFGRGGRMKIEQDEVEILSGLRFGQTIGSPIALKINNRDWKNWQDIMDPQEPKEVSLVTTPRPGHADLPGILKTNQKDIRNVLERASARETAARVAAGAVAKKLLREIGIAILSHVIQIGQVKTTEERTPLPKDLPEIDASLVRCGDKKTSEKMVEAIKQAEINKDTLGGIFEVLIYGTPPGLGSYNQWNERLNANLARALMSIPAIKGVEIGKGFALASLPGSQAHDEIFYQKGKGYFRTTNRAGGIEGGMSNGEVILLRAVMKPIPTLASPLKTVDLQTRRPTSAFKERSDICAVPSAAVIGEAVIALEVAKEAQKKFGGDSIEEFKQNYRNYLKLLEKWQ